MPTLLVTNNYFIMHIRNTYLTVKELKKKMNPVKNQAIV